MADSVRQVKRDGLIVDIFEDQDGVTVTVGDYDTGAGAAMCLNYEYVGELVDEDLRNDLETLLDVGIEEALDYVVAHNKDVSNDG